jgi:hypothetical protein
MTNADLVRDRLINQRLTGAPCATAVEVVRHLGAVQAQDYSGAKWAIAQRTKDATDAQVEQALSDGVVLRTHVLRPTWHFVSATDIRWMLEVTATRIRALMAYYDRKLELDATVYKRSNTALAKALRDGKCLTRTELGGILSRARVDARGTQRLGHLLMRAELDGVVCSGPRRGKQATYALLAERAPKARSLGRDEALGELAKRYFVSHGPATIKDFAWWSGLTVADATRAAESVRGALERHVCDKTVYWSGSVSGQASRRVRSVRLLPKYDEYHVAYKDRSAMLVTASMLAGSRRTPALGDNVMAVDGQLIGTWKRVAVAKRVVLRTTTMRRLTGAEGEALTRQAKRYGDFWGCLVETV